MQHCHDDLRRGYPLLMNICGYSPAVISNSDRFVRMNNHLDIGTITFLRLVNRIIHQLLHHVMQAGSIVRISNVHAGAFSNRSQSLEDLDAAGIVGFVIRHLYSPPAPWSTLLLNHVPRETI